MAECHYKIAKGVGRLKPDTLVLLLLLAWWVLNLVQAALTGLADDEAYYWYFAQHLDWGYFDHPPMVALLVHLSGWLRGALGVRFFSVLLQPLYLFVFWHLVKPGQPSLRDALLYVLICFSQPLLQLYGFLAVPDAPLMFATVLFLWTYRRFYQSGKMVDALLLGGSIALLGYSKYHGILVIAFTLLATPAVFRKRGLYVAGLVAVLLLVPHVIWQQQHDWVSLQYHLSGRNAWDYRPSFTTEYLATVLVLFNPLWLFHLAKGIIPTRAEGWPAKGRVAVVVMAGFILFFLVATLRGRVQPQWLLPVALPAVALVFKAGRRSRYVYVASIVCALLFIVVRFMAIANPIGLKGQLWEGDEPYRKIEAIADGRPVEFLGCYSFAAKYAYYTGRPTHCSSFYYSRDSQWQYDTADRSFRGSDVVVCDLGDLAGKQIEMDAKRNCRYIEIADYLPTRELEALPLGPINAELRYLQRTDTSKVADSLPAHAMSLAVVNHYGFDIVPDTAQPICVMLCFQDAVNSAYAAKCLLSDTLRAGDTTVLHLNLRVPTKIKEGPNRCCIAIGYNRYAPAANSPVWQATVRKDSLGVSFSVDNTYINIAK